MTDRDRISDATAGTDSRSVPEYMNLTEAHKYIGCSWSKLTSLISSGKIPFEADPLDNRVKLVKRSDLDKLRSRRCAA